jgi:hypothetical protein
MPLMKSKSKKAVGHNVDVEEGKKKPYKQAIAIALSVKKDAKSRDMGDKMKKTMKKDKCAKK